MSRRFFLPPQELKRPLRFRNRSISKGGRIAVVIGAAILVLLFIFWIPWGKRTDDATEKLTQRVPLAASSDTNATPNETQALRTTNEKVMPRDSARETAGPRVPILQNPVRLQVLNGCGVKGLAKLISPALRAKGFDVRENRNAGSFRHTFTTVVDRTGAIELAYRVADSLGVDHSRVSTQPARNLVDIDVTVIVGADWENLNLHTNSTSKE